MNLFRWMLVLAFSIAGVLALGSAAAGPDDPAPGKAGSVLATREFAPVVAEPPVKPGLTATDPRAPGQKLPAFIRPPTPRVGLEILVGGQPLATVRHLGKTYVPVPRLGAEYEIRVSNHGPNRVAALVAVDGLSVITGQPHSADQPGYVVATYGQVRIKGWRRSLDAVATFRFVERERSYAALMGYPEKVGTITLLAIEEQARWLRPLQERDAGAAASKAAYGRAGSVGTEYGREIDSRVYYVPFVRSANRWTITYYYDTPEALRAAGVPIDLLPPSPGPSEFAPPPPGYRGK